MNIDELKAILLQSIEDEQLTRSEKQALSQLFASVVEEINPAQLRRLAVDAARERLRGELAGDVMDWLGSVLKTIDALEPAKENRVAEVYFSPTDDCWKQIVRLLDQATKKVEICVFTITDDRLASAILSAHRRGVIVRIITDDEKAWDVGSDIAQLKDEGIALRTDRTQYHMHHKFAVFDDRLVLSGSYNWTRSASVYNEENFLVVDDRRLIQAYSKTFESLWKAFE